MSSLELSYCRAVSDVGISKIGEGCPELRSLHLEDCHKVTDAGISKIGEGCRQLQSLDLSYCHKVTDAGISKIGEGCRQLRSLHLGFCGFVTDVGSLPAYVHRGMEIADINSHGKLSSMARKSRQTRRQPVASRISLDRKAKPAYEWSRSRGSDDDLGQRACFA